MKENDLISITDEEVESLTSASYKEYVTCLTTRIHKYLEAFNNIIWQYKNSGILTIYDAGFIDLDKQYLTIGINGFVEGAEFLGIDVNPYEDEYKEYAKNILETIKQLNAIDRTSQCKFNTEFVPSL